MTEIYKIKSMSTNISDTKLYEHAVQNLRYNPSAKSVNTLINNGIGRDRSKAFGEYLRKGIDPISSTEHQLTPGGSSLGVPADLETFNSFREAVSRKVPLFNLAKTVEVSEGQIKLITNFDQLNVSWASDGNANSQANSVITHDISLCELYTTVQVPSSTVQDPKVNVTDVVMDTVQARFSQEISKALSIGAGGSQPRGLFTKDAVNGMVQVKSGGGIGEKSILEAYGALPAYYRSAGEVSILVNRKYIAEFLGAVNNSAHKWGLPGYSSGDSNDGTLLGCQVYYIDHMPDNVLFALGAVNLAFVLITSGNLKISRDPYSAFPRICYNASYQLGSGVIDPKAMVVAIKA